MAPKRTMTAYLLESNRITADDVERGLEHQRRHGGYLGEALVELGLVRREEIDWALASQLDLPFVFPDAESADREATRLVTAEWALAHLAVPIVHGGDSITVVVTDPLDRDTLDDLAERTGLRVEMALASASRIRELIRAVYGSAELAVEAQDAPVPLSDFVTEALAHGAERIGVSARGTRGLGWWAHGEVRERRRLADGWDDALETLLDPPPLERAREAEGRLTGYEAKLTQPGAALGADVQVTTTLSGLELVLRPRRRQAALHPGSGLPDDLRADLRMLAAGGSARVGVSGEGEWVDGVLAQLPALVLGDAARAAHVVPEGDLPGIFTLRPGDDADAFAAAVHAYAFDALTVDLPLDHPGLASILAAAPLAFARVGDDADPAALDRAGLRWLLTVSGDQGGLAWELRSTNR